MKRSSVAALLVGAAIAVSGVPVAAKTNPVSCQQIKGAMPGKTPAQVAKELKVSVDRVNHCTASSKTTSAKHTSATTAVKQKPSTSMP